MMPSLYRRSGGSSLAFVLAVAVVSVGLTAATDETDPAYWARRVEQSLLPLASLRADLVLVSEESGQPVREVRGRLARIHGPGAIRSVVAIESPPMEQRVLKVQSTSKGEAERVLYAGAGDPVEIRVDRYDRVLRTAFTYEDLGFVERRHLEDATVDLEELPTGEVVRLTTKPYGPYGKVVLRLDPDTAIPFSIEYFDRKGALQRTVKYDEIDREGPHKFPLRVEAREVGTGRRSEARFASVELGSEIFEYEFDDRHLRLLLRQLQATPAL